MLCSLHGVIDIQSCFILGLFIALEGIHAPGSYLLAKPCMVLSVSFRVFKILSYKFLIKFKADASFKSLMQNVSPLPKFSIIILRSE